MSDNTHQPILVFDVNETLLDITTLTPLFTRVFGDADRLREWFAQLILYSQTMTLAGLYTPFGELGVGALRMLGTIHSVDISDEDVNELQTRMGTIPAHPDVVPGLKRLRSAGFRLVTLTNSASATAPSPLERAGLGSFFERTFSVESVQKFKPAAETYQFVAREMGVKTSGLCLVACHLWDTIGAQAAGCHGAFIMRPDNALLPVAAAPEPDFVALDLTQLCDQIVKRWPAA